MAVHIVECFHGDSIAENARAVRKKHSWQLMLQLVRANKTETSLQTRPIERDSAGRSDGSEGQTWQFASRADAFSEFAWYID